MATSEVLGIYKEQLETTVSTLRRRSVDLSDEAVATASALQQQINDLRANLEPRIQEGQAAVGDMSAVKEESGSFVLETYLWGSICLFGVSVGQLLGGYVATYVLGWLLSDWTSLLLANVALPLYAYVWQRKSTGSPSERRTWLLSLSLLLGLLSGHNLSNRSLDVLTPPAFLPPLLASLSAEYSSARLSNNRPAWLGATVGVGAAACLAVGLTLGQLSATYLLYTAAYSALALINLQLTLASLQQGHANPSLTQINHIVGTITINTILGFLLGNTQTTTAQPISSETTNQQ